jgi:peptide chain release factor subunit 1
MIREADLQELVAFDGAENRVLSLYLDVDPRNTTMELYRLTLRSLLEKATDADPADKAQVEQFIDLEYNRQARGLVIFSCQKRDFWRVYPLDVPVKNMVMVSRRPLVRGLVDMLNTFGHLGVVAIDKQGARFYSFHLGALEEVVGALGEDVKRHKQGGWASSRYQRHEDEAARSNLKSFVELADAFTRQYGWRQLILAGAHETVSQFQNMLPPHLNKLVIGTMPLEPDASLQEVRERAETLARDAYERRTQALAEELIVQANKGDMAVLGLESTLDALQQSSVWQLFFTEGYTLPENKVHRCTHCNYLTTDQADVCPLCGGEMRPMVDAINNIARRAIAQGAQVVALPPDNPLEAADAHIGAFLRY